MTGLDKADEALGQKVVGIEGALRQSRLENRALLNAITDFVFRINKNGELEDLKEACAADPTANSATSSRKNAHAVLPTTIASPLIQKVELAMKTGAPQVLEYRLTLNDKPHDYEARIIKCNIGCCNEDEVIAIVRDITEYKLAMEELRASEENFRTLITEINDGFFITDNRGVITFANKALANIHGFERPDEVVGKNFVELIVHGAREKILNIFKSDITTGRIHQKQVEVPILRRNGSVGFAEVRPNLVLKENKVIGTRGVIRDITEQKKAEEERRKAEEKFRSLFESTLDGVYWTNAEGIFTLINRAGAELLGYKSSEGVIGKRAVDYWANPKDRETFLEELKRRKRIRDYHVRGKRSSGEEIDMAITARLLEENGTFQGVEGIIREVTEKRRIQDELKKRVEELEKFHKLTVGRELKMIELKERIMELERRLAEYEGNAIPKKIWLK